MKLDKLFFGLNISALGLTAQRKRMNAIASNMANVETTRTEEGGPYRRKIVVVKENAQASFTSTLHSVESELLKTQEGHMSGSGQALSGGKIIASGVIAQEEEDTSTFKLVHDPSHPDANEEGYVKLPNINIVTEMVDMISASRAYEANVTAVNAAKSMTKDALEI